MVDLLLLLLQRHHLLLLLLRVMVMVSCCSESLPDRVRVLPYNKEPKTLRRMLMM
jgi:hypothetical protein